MKIIDKKLLENLPNMMILVIMLISILGCVLIYSAENGNINLALKQFTIVIFSFLSSLIIANIELRKIYNFSYISYLIAIILLVLVILVGYKAMGAKRWLNLVFFKFQPSEFVKIAVIMTLAKFIHNTDTCKMNKPITILQLLMIIAIPFLLIAKQPDLGTAISIIVIGGAILFCTNINIWFFITNLFLIAASVPVIWNILHEYQRNRIRIFLNPDSDPLGHGYNIIQSKIAIGSGGLFGKGFMNGSQSQLEFLPENQTDFIFATLAEEFGYLGCLILLALYLYIIIHSLSIASKSRKIFPKLIVIGSISYLTSQIIINIFMVSGFLPVVGIPLPLLSYGRTSILASFIALGFIFNVAKLNKSYVKTF